MSRVEQIWDKNYELLEKLSKKLEECIKIMIELDHWEIEP